MLRTSSVRSEYARLMHATNVWCPEMIVVAAASAEFALDRHAVTQGELRRFRIATGRRVDAWQPKNDHVVARVDDVEAHAYASWAGKRVATKQERADDGLYCASAARLDREQMLERIATPDAARAFVEQRLRALPRTCFVGLEVPVPPLHSFAAYTAAWSIGMDPDLLDPDSFFAHVLLLDGRDATLHIVHGYGYGGQLLTSAAPLPLRALQSEVYSLRNVIASLRPLHEVLLARMEQLPAVRWNAS